MRIAINASGTVDDYSPTVLSQVAAAFALRAGVTDDNVRIDVIAGSVILRVDISTPSKEIAQSVEIDMASVLRQCSPYHYDLLVHS